MWNYEILKRYANNGNKIGDWKGKGVYVTSCEDLSYLNSKNYYIIYDDDNKLIECKLNFMNDYIWMVVGYVSSNGNVKDCMPFKYENPNLKIEMKNETKKSNEKMNSKNDVKTSNKKVNSKTDVKNDFEIDEVIGDVRLGMLVDETLQTARTTTVDSLLAGFNYGLDEAVG